MIPKRPDAYLNDRLDWNLLRTFLVIAREKSVSRAAARLHLTQPAVSQALRRLEEQLSLRLVDRHGPRITVTRAGIEVQRIAEEIYGTISRLAISDVDGECDISGMVRVATVSGIDFEAYDMFLARFHQTYPRIDFETQEMRSADVVNTMQQKAATIGLTPCRRLPKGIEARLFLRQRYALFCGQQHPLYEREDLSLADIEGQPLVSFSGDRVGDHMSPLTIFRDEKGFTGRIVASSSSMTEVKRFISAGLGIGCLPTHLVNNEIDRHRFRRLPPDEGIADLDIAAIWPSERKQNAAEAAFCAALQRFLDGQRALDEVSPLSQ